MITQKVLRLKPREDFVLTPHLERVCQRAMTYLDAGYACHFRGSAGTGKTTLAMHVANQRGRPVVLLFGDEEFGTADLVGAEKGLVSTKVTDNFVKSVTRTEEFRRPQWVDNRLTTACRQGLTLVYDEFSRSRAEANNVLLTVLEERILPVPDTAHGTNYMPVHPDFRAIFTSNPEDYAGVHKTQNALLDRMITIELDFYDRETEVAITQARAGIERGGAERIVDFVRRIRATAGSQQPTLRASIMIARVVKQMGAEAFGTPAFADVCVDILHPTSQRERDGRSMAASDAIRSAVRAAGAAREV